MLILPYTVLLYRAVDDLPDAVREPAAAAGGEHHETFHEIPGQYEVDELAFRGGHQLLQLQR